MDLVHAGDIPWEGFAEQRGGRIRQKRLLTGQAGSPQNFEFSLVRVDEKYWTPRHRHIFDQVRFVRTGTFGYGTDKIQQPGEVSYFPEGVYYTNLAEGESETLLLQLGSASGFGFVKREETLVAIAALGEKGEFHDGIYTTRNAAGQKVNQDATEAIYEYYLQRKIRYPASRYDQPILMHPKGFDWISQPDHSGAATKLLGSFTERQLKIGFLKLDADSRHAYRDDDAPTLFFVLSGSGDANDQGWQPNSALLANKGETLRFHAQSPAELYWIRLPVFAEK